MTPTRENVGRTMLSLMPMIGQEDEASQNQAQYLSYRYAGFTPTEALKLINSSWASLRQWRDENDYFNQMENAALDKILRKELWGETLNLMFSRNMIMIAKKDEQILKKAIGQLRDEDGNILELTGSELTYLNKMRGTYSPTQMEAVNKLNQVNATQFNIGQLILNNQGEDNAPGEDNLQEVIIESPQLQEGRDH